MGLEAVHSARDPTWGSMHCKPSEFINFPVGQALGVDLKLSRNPGFITSWLSDLESALKTSLMLFLRSEMGMIEWFFCHENRRSGVREAEGCSGRVVIQGFGQLALGEYILGHWQQGDKGWSFRENQLTWQERERATEKAGWGWSPEA